MKKRFIISCLFLCTLFFIPGSSALAQQSLSNSGALKSTQQIQQRVSEKVATGQARIRQKIVERVRNVVGVRFNVFERALNRCEILLDKLQIRIDKAGAGDKDTAEAVSLMDDARSKLDDAKAKLADIQGKKGEVVDKVEFQDIKDKLQAVHKDLNIIRQDGSKIIRILKSFNSATSSGQNL